MKAKLKDLFERTGTPIMLIATALLLAAAIAVRVLVPGQAESDPKARPLISDEELSKLGWGEGAKTAIAEFADVDFYLSQAVVTAVKDGVSTELYGGMPIQSYYLCDLTGDGLPELCSAVYYGSGMIDSHLIVYDYANAQSYVLWERGVYDYYLELVRDRLYAVRKPYMKDTVESRGRLVLDDGKLVMTAGN